MNHPANSQALEVTVERVLPFGIFVRLPDGSPGYIRRRELDLDADVEPAEILQVGEKIWAEVIKTEAADSRIELSRRATLKDPWPEFAKHHHEGDVVRGTVRALHPTGAFVRLQAGIRGLVPIAEIASWWVDKPEDVLWIGDTVEAQITNLDASNQRLTLSIRSLMLQREENQISSKLSSSQLKSHPSLSLTKEPIPTTPALIPDAIGPILVVDDHDDVRSSLTEWLNYRGFVVFEAESLERAISLSEKHTFQVFLADLNLMEKDGLDLVRHLRKNGNQAHICVMSSLDALNERAEEIEAAHVSQVFPKPLDVEEIVTFLLRLAHNEQIPAWRATPRASSTPRAVESGGRDLLPIQKRLQMTLEQAAQLVRAEVGLIFQLDAASRAISILAQWGESPLHLDALYGLRASPVEDVIREDGYVIENHVSEQAKAKFAKLLELLPFESCIGVSIQVHGEIQHAAFFFHREPNVFSRYRLRDAQAAALLLAAILAQETLEKQIQSLNPMLLSGELARGFGHDIFNKITALDLQARLLTGHKNRDEIQTSAQHLLDLILDLKATVQAFQGLLQTKESHERFDVNQVVKNAIALLQPIAHKEHTKIEINHTFDLPPVIGNAVILQQVFLNLMLNAVQQMSLKAAKFHWNGPRIMRVTTSINRKEGKIRIRITDNGPGIHQAHLKKIFSPGFSTRGGSGLGLYIARGFVQSLGGLLRVQETLVLLGTTFLVELPFSSEESIEWTNQS